MRVLFLGEIGHGQTSLMRMRAMGRLGHVVTGVNTISPWKNASWMQRQMQRRIGLGSVITEINEGVRKVAAEFRPDLVWAEKQEFLTPETLETLGRGGARLVHFTPDPYFWVPWKRTRLMDDAITYFDVLVFCKEYERKNYEALGKVALYMPLGYCDETHRPLGTAGNRWNCEVGFLGGWDPYREENLAAIAKSGADLKIWGNYWDFVRDGRWSLRRSIIMRQLAGGAKFSIKGNAALAGALQGTEVYGDDYARALTGSRIGLGFLRRAWPDEHTTRTFEIPACGSMLLGYRTAEHQAYFTEGEEAEFFSSEEELVSKIRFYSANPSDRDRVAAAGLRRCRTARYSYKDRLEMVLGQIAGL